MELSHQIAFDPAAPEDALTQLPARAAVFALRGVSGEPYLNRTTDLRRRLTRLLAPAVGQSKRLQLAGLVRHIAWQEIASEFAGQLLLFKAAHAAFGERATKRLHLYAPYFLRMGMRNRYPRTWVTNTITTGAAGDLFGPFPSRNAAERYLEQVLDLYLLRRCFQDLEPDPAFPGCIYSEMKKCLAPCYGGCSDARYAEEAAAVHGFLRTGGAALLATLAAERERASEALDFEAAAAAHARYSKAEAVTALAPELARAFNAQRAVLVQPAGEPDQVALYLLERGVFTGPVLFSVLGMRLPNEQSGSSSLFAHPAAFAAVPLEPPPADKTPEKATSTTPDDRLRTALDELFGRARGYDASKQQVCDHQALLARWYFRPQAKREGELLMVDAAVGLPSNNASGGFSVPSTGLKALLRACARVYRTQVERHAPAQTLAP